MLLLFILEFDFLINVIVGFGFQSIIELNAKFQFFSLQISYKLWWYLGGLDFLECGIVFLCGW
jgi:hypothetical protein